MLRLLSWGAETVCGLALAEDYKHARKAEEVQSFGEGVDEIFTYYL